MARKKWTVSKYDKALAVSLAQQCDIDQLVALILSSRGYTSPFELEEFLSGEFELSDPYTLPDMEKAVLRIRKAIEEFEKITVYGDYDADGVTATSILYAYLCSQDANAGYYIPTRAGEGYGMNNESLEKLKAEGTTLIITVDNGISAANEIEYAKSLGIDVVVTDHHLPPEILPDACALVNPHLKDSRSPFPEISGAFVAYKLVCALEGCACEEMLDEYSDLAALGTVADIMPLVGENRVMVKHGLRSIMSGVRPGIEALIDEAGLKGKKLTASTLGFVLGPRINAAGRMGRSDRAVKLLISSDESEVRYLAEEICGENAKRQQTEAEIIEKAKAQAISQNFINDKIIVVSGDGWHSGVVGIVASRLTELYGKPSIVLSIDNGIATGSGRSIKGFSLHEALKNSADCLRVYGGHEMAGGMTLDADKIDPFRRRINDYAKTVDMPYPELKIDCRINPKFIDLDTVYALMPLEPFGSGNPSPVFGLYNLRIDSVYPLSSGKHVKLTVSRDSTVNEILCFGRAAEEFPFQSGDMIDAAVALDLSEYNGEKKVSIMLRDIRLSESDDLEVLESMRLYESFCRGEAVSPDVLHPEREEIAKVYRTLRSSRSKNINFEIFAKRLDLSYVKLHIILDILSECSLIKLDAFSTENAAFMLCAVEGKVDLESSEILQSLRKEAAV